MGLITDLLTAGASGGAGGGDSSLAETLIKKFSKKSKNKAAAKQAPDSSQDSPISAWPSEFKHGGKVKRTGMALVHKGERVLTRKQAKRRSTRKQMSR